MTKKELKELIKRAEAGDAEAQYELARYYYTEGEEDSEELAYHWFGQAAEQGHTEAEYMFAHCMMCGVGTRYAWAEGSLKYFLRAAGKGHVEAMKTLSELYSHRLICTDWDFDKAFYWIKKAAETGDIEAKYDLADVLLHGFPLSDIAKYESPLDPEEGIRILKEIAAAGYTRAMDMLGDCYRDGAGVQKDLDEAIKWYQKGSKEDRDSLFKLGEYYFKGEGVPQNYEMAAKYFEKAAIKYHAGARVKLGDCYYNGWGVEQSFETALRYYESAAIADEFDTDGGKTNLCLMYSRDEHYRDEEKAVIWLHRTMNYTFNPVIFYEVALRHMIGVDFRDDKKTFECYVFRKNFEDAAHYFKRACEEKGGYPPAFLEYGKCLLNGIGVEPDREEAIKWIQKAADAGVDGAAELLKS